LGILSVIFQVKVSLNSIGKFVAADDDSFSMIRSSARSLPARGVAFHQKNAWSAPPFHLINWFCQNLAWIRRRNPDPRMSSREEEEIWHVRGRSSREVSFWIICCNLAFLILRNNWQIVTCWLTDLQTLVGGRESLICFFKHPNQHVRALPNEL
jgi:hypothetical protein